jgi:hypothetical protein
VPPDFILRAAALFKALFSAAGCFFLLGTDIGISSNQCSDGCKFDPFFLNGLLTSDNEIREEVSPYERAKHLLGIAESGVTDLGQKRKLFPQILKVLKKRKHLWLNILTCQWTMPTQRWSVLHLKPEFEISSHSIKRIFRYIDYQKPSHSSYTLNKRQPLKQVALLFPLSGKRSKPDHLTCD